jgi:hypothetical protein
MMSNSLLTSFECLRNMNVKCAEKKFGDSLGDMERHILTEHMQTADFLT